MLKFLRPRIGARGELNVFRNVDHDRPRPSAGRDVERLVQRARQIGDGLDQIIVFGARPGDADGIALLERVVADQMRRHLPGDDHERDRVAESIGQAGDGIGRAGSRGDQHGADLPGRARVAFGGMHRALLVTHQDMLDLLLIEQCVVDRQHRAAGITKNVLDALIGERRDHHFRAGHFRHGQLRFLKLCLHAVRSENKKGAQEPLFSRIATFRGWVHPPPAMRLPTSTSEMNTKCRTGRALFRGCL